MFVFLLFFFVFFFCRRCVAVWPQYFESFLSYFQFNNFFSSAPSICCFPCPNLKDSFCRLCCLKLIFCLSNLMFLFLLTFSLWVTVVLIKLTFSESLDSH